jgi:hypothetical protein
LKIYGLGSMIQGMGFRVLGFRVSEFKGLGYEVLGFRV